MAAEISEQKLLKKLMRISDSYYKTLDAKTCVTNLNDALENPITLKIMDFDYHKGLIYPLFPLEDKYRFYKYTHANRRMSELLDWHCEKGDIRVLLRQIYADILEQSLIRDEELCKLDRKLFSKYI